MSIQRPRNNSVVSHLKVPNKTQLSHRRMREAVARINREAAERLASGKPVHRKLVRIS